MKVYLDVMDAAAEPVRSRERTAPLHPTGGPGWSDETWLEFFRRTKRDGVADAAVPPVTKTLVEQRVVDPATEKGLGAAITKLLKRTTDAGWPVVRLSYSRVAVSDLYYADDADLKPGQEVPDHRRGDLRKAAHECEFWWVHAAHPAYRIALRAAWQEKGRTAKGSRSFAFEEALCTDPLGMPTEFFFDYTPLPSLLARAKGEPGWAHEERVARMRQEAERRDRDYNDGASWLNRRPVFTTAAAFNEWLDDVIALTTGAPIAKSAKPAPEPTDEWSAA
ncbi:hypothetical protein [Microbacterium sp. No. 7]|uniref:hypothetical protein n=1 Tax=Microbacterium sp. No. 7 TaxID=1714373 RepID=UPI000A6034F3|nr:hypothetical protein [Microbacterium sp. No. 7]